MWRKWLKMSLVWILSRFNVVTFRFSLLCSSRAGIIGQRMNGKSIKWWSRMKNGKKFLIFFFFGKPFKPQTNTHKQIERHMTNNGQRICIYKIFLIFLFFCLFFFFQSRLWLAILTEKKKTTFAHHIVLAQQIISHQMKRKISSASFVTYAALKLFVQFYGLSLRCEVDIWKNIINNDNVGELKYLCANRCFNVQFKYVLHCTYSNAVQATIMIISIISATVGFNIQKVESGQWFLRFFLQLFLFSFSLSTSFVVIGTAYRVPRTAHRTQRVWLLHA